MKKLRTIIWMIGIIGVIFNQKTLSSAEYIDCESYCETCLVEHEPGSPYYCYSLVNCKQIGNQIFCYYRPSYCCIG